MEIVNTLDIDGTQWEMQDVEARNKIAGIEQLLKTETVNNIPINLNSGNSAKQKQIKSIQKFGKMYIGLIVLENLSAGNIGTLNRVDVGTINVNVLDDTYSLGFDYINNKTVRFRITSDKKFYIEESLGVSKGKNLMLAQITWIEP